ncbi:hypothetical protein Cpa01nite_15760 [Cellulomonas pakistanensis]|uniref:Restriction endonuclease type II-like domain-containing protein n=1 Tax=Cellulomonas pakistanensis TaxID=992287 RepID=A0A919P8A2_9CELL|nr:hypothetical protein Cpa01nite_15760 [Cellulomonas pakistanensis]
MPDAAAGPVLVEPPSAAELVAGATGTWRAALVEAAGGSTLADVELLGDAALDLSAAHPSGIAQLFAGRETRLSNLVREGAALGTARRRARAVAARAGTYAQQYGIAPTYLAIGVASWTEHSTPDVATDDVAAIATATRESAGRGEDGDGDPADGDAPAPATRSVRAPVLLRPVSLTARGTAESDYELTLEPSLEVNPVLARALRSRGALLDPGAVARSAFTGSGFDPRDAITRLTSLGTAVLDDFQLVDRIVVGTFVHPGQVLVDDLDRLAPALERHEVVAALAGVAEAADGLQVTLPEPVRGDRDPALERGVGDLDPAQQHVLDVVAGGAHVFVDAPADSDVTGTLAALVADAAAEGRTVLYVPGHRRAAVALRERLERLGVGEVLLDVAPDAAWRAASARRLMGAMTLDVDPGDPAATAELRRALVERRERLRGYVDGLHLVREPWGASAYDGFQALARLTAARPAPRTTVRLPAEVARALDAERRAAVAAELTEAAEAGAFTLRPVDTPWYGAALLGDAEAADALRRAERLAGETGLPAVQARIAEVAEVTGFTPATTLATWAEQLEVLGGVRGALDVFQPIVFERSPADMVAATASKAWRAEHGTPMGFWLRRRLKKQAKDLLRPGRPVADLHAALLDVQRQRAIWAEHCPAGGWPRLPEGLGEIEAEHREVRADVEALAAVLAGTPEGADLLGRPIPEVLERVRRLVDAGATLERLPERTRLLRSLRAAGLDDLLDDLADRRVAASLVGAELELAWWSTVFEQVLAADPALAGYDGRTLGRLAAEYRELDVAHTAALAGPVRARAAAHVRNTMAAHTEQTEALFAELVEERLTGLRETFERYPDVARRLRPVLAAAPMLVPQILPAARTVDLVVLDAAAHLPVEVALPAIARGRQVVVVGDRRCASGTAVRELADVLPTVPLRADASRRDPYLTAFLAAHGYADVLSPTPLPTSGATVGHHLVDGTGMPDGSGAVQSTRADVDRVVELVIEHALTRPAESLAVVTASPLHTAQIRESVLAQVRDSPSLAACLDGSRPEPFVVTDLTNVAGLRRDALILSLGFGRTPHGRVLHRFGPISGPGGDALLLAALGVTRHRLDVVSCFAIAEVDPERLRGPGPRLLADLLRFAELRSAGETDLAVAAPVAEEPVADGAPGDAAADVPAAEEVAAPVVAEEVKAPAEAHAPDRLVVDLAERLWRHGLVVELDHGLPGGLHLPLAVGHPDLPGELLVAVLTDDDAYLHEPSVRVRDRQVAERLERLGWSVLRVWSAAAFLDPEAEVDRIRRALHAVADRRIAEAEADRARARLIVPAPLLDDDGSGPAPTLTGFAVVPGADLPTGGGARPGERRVLDATGAITVVPDESADREDEAPAPVAEAAGPWSPPAAPGGAAGAGGSTPAGAGAPDAVAPPSSPIPAVAAQIPGVMEASAPMTGAVRAVQPTLAVPGGPRPDVRPGLPISAYSDDQLDDLVAWLVSDGSERTPEELAAALRAELGITRRGARVDSVVAAAVARATR